MLFDCKIVEIIFIAAAKLLDVVVPKQRTQLVGININEERMMIGQISNIVKTIDDRLIWIQCALYQLGFMVQVEYIKLYHDQFINILISFISYLCQQYNLIKKMVYTCPKFIYTQWSSIRKLSGFLQQRHIVIYEYLAQKMFAYILLLLSRWYCSQSTMLQR